MKKVKPERKTKTDSYHIVVLHTASEKDTEKFILSRTKNVEGTPLPLGIKKVERRYWHMSGPSRFGFPTPSYLMFVIDNTIYNTVKLMNVVKEFLIKDLKIDDLPDGITKIREEWFLQDSKAIKVAADLATPPPTLSEPSDVMEKPRFACEYCPKTCSSTAGLTLHLKNCKKKPTK